MDKHLNIISLNVPLPANYGGVIDIFYKLKALHREGVGIILHTFAYGRPPMPELAQYCEEVYYYKRETGLISNLSLRPYNVVSRRDPRLLERLLSNDYPILFEGLHSCYYLSDKRLKDRVKVVRSANIEHDYYYHLFKAGGNLLRQGFFYIESLRFKQYEKQLRHADLIAAISLSDQEALQNRYAEKRVELIPAFHANEQITSREGSSDFILYHGKLSVEENNRAALYLIKNVFSKLKYDCVIAGMNPSRELIRAAQPFPNLKIEANPDSERMSLLIENAHVHALITFQSTGLKLKLLNSLFAGRHVLVNSLMLVGSGLDALCYKADTPDEMVSLCNKLMLKPFTPDCIGERKAALFPLYDNKTQAKRLCTMIYETNMNE